MLIKISGGKEGIKQYLEDGQKRGRGFSREEADKRVTLYGDLDVTDEIIRSLDYKENYHHITLSFKEDYVSEEDLQRATDEFITFMRAAYQDDEMNIYAEAHIPKIKSYRSKSGELVIRKPHIHIVMPNVNMLTQKYLEPFGRVTNNIHYIDAFQELYNQNQGFESPKDNPRNRINLESSIVSRHKGDLFTMNRVEKEEILSYIIDNDITSYEEFEKYLQAQGNVKIRNKGKDSEYFNIKYPHENKGINLKDFCFSKEFIENYTKADKLDFLMEKSEEVFLEKKEAYLSKNSQKQEELLKEWFDLRAKEIKYMNYKSKFYKETYKNASYDEKISILEKKEMEFYQKHNIKKQIEQELNSLSPMAIASKEQNLYQSPMATTLNQSEKQKFSAKKHHKTTSNFVNSKIRDIEESKKLQNIDFMSELKGNLIFNMYDKLSKEKGVLQSKYSVDENGIYLNNSSKRRVDLKEFLVEQMNLTTNEIQKLQDSIQRIELNYSKFNIKGYEMSPIHVNIKRDNQDRNKVDYMQIGSVSRAGKFTGFVYDHADRKSIGLFSRKIESSATLFMINDKVVSYEEFKQLPNFKDYDDKMKLLVESSKETIYSPKLRMNYTKENLTLTGAGQTYANSRHNFSNELQPIRVGINTFPNDRKVNENIWTVAKKFVLEHWHKGKDFIQTALTSKYDLAASNVALAAELQQMKQKLEDIKTYNEAIEKQAQLIKEHQAKEEAQKQEAENKNKKEFSFSELYEKLDRAGNLKDTVKWAQEVEADPDFAKTKETALNMINNIKDGKVELDKETVKQFTLSQAQTVNMMSDKGFPVKTIEAVKEFVKVIQNVKNMSLEQGLDFEKLLNDTLNKMADKLHTPEQKQQRAKEQEQEQDGGIER